MDKYSIEAGCTCLDSAYERKAIDDGLNHNPVFPENIQYLKEKSMSDNHAVLSGTYECPICDNDKPHWHTENEKAQFNQDRLRDQFSEWIYDNYMVWNGDRLVLLMEDTEVQSKFLESMGLPEDTEL